MEGCSIYSIKEELFRFAKLGDTWIPKVILGDIRKLAGLLPDNFIDCVITSPPYWMQRDYKHPNQIGREDTPEQYVETIANVFELLRPKLKKTATIFLNVGYKYLHGRLILIPEMIALEMEKRHFILKNKIIWWKPNAMPSPARDRLNDVYEPVLFFTRDDGKEVHYFNLEEISQRTKTLDHFVSLLSVNPEELLGVKATDPISGKEKKEGKVIGTRFTSTKIYEILIQWNDGIREWMPYGEPLKNYPEKISFACPLCKSSLSEWDIRLSFANLGKMICPQCEALLCESAETFPIPQFPSLLDRQQNIEVKEIINPDIETKKYVTKAPKSSKFIKAGLNEIFMASPAGRLAIQGEYLTIKRRWEAPQHLIAKFLKFWREQKGVSVEDIDKELGYSYTAGHWFRLDFGWWGKGGSIPRPKDWERLKKLLGFNDIYDRLVTECVAVLQTVKPHEEGRNPGDVWEITIDEYIEELKDYLKSNLQEPGDIWKIVLEPYSEAHFSIFPSKLVETAIKLGCPPNGVVLDPFAGSGTVGQVAMKLGRKAILIELIPEFLDLIKKRCGKIEILPV